MISSSFKAKVNQKTEFPMDRAAIEELDIDALDDHRYHVLQNQSSFHAILIEHDFEKRQYTIRIGSNVYHVNITTDLDDLIESMGYELSSESAANDIKAPMPGIILEMKAEPGVKVSKGDTLLILEAMKMENAILSPKDGVVKTVWSKKGDTVDKNKLLIELE